MMKKVLLLAAISVLTVNVAYPGDVSAADEPKQVKSGELIPIGETLFIKVMKGTKPFEGIKVKGEAMVVVLEMDAGKQGATLFYKINANPAASEVYLLSGARRVAPRAVMEDFPSWGKDNDKDIDSLDPKETVGGTTLTFQQKGSISLLFDVPLEDARAPKKLSVALRMVQPKDETRSFVVTL